MRLHVHLHGLALDGVYVRDAESGKLGFEELEVARRAEVLEVARRTAERIDADALLRKSGRGLERAADEPEPELLLDEPGLASCYAAATSPAHRFRKSDSSAAQSRAPTQASVEGRHLGSFARAR